MPYQTVADLPPSFKNLPQGAQTIAMETMNSVLEGKVETKELVTQALQAAWVQIKRKYRKEGNKWVAKSALLTVAPKGLTVVHRILADEMGQRGMAHDTLWPTEKMGAVETARKEISVEMPGSFEDWLAKVRRAVEDNHTAFGAMERHEAYTEVTYPNSVIVRCFPTGQRFHVPYAIESDGDVTLDLGQKVEIDAAVLVASQLPSLAKSDWARVLKADEGEQTIAGIVYMADDEAIDAWVAKGSPKDEKPEVVDTQDDWVREANLKLSFRDFMETVDRIARSGDERAFGVAHRSLSPKTILLQSALLCKGTHWPDADSPPLTAKLNWVVQTYEGDKAVWEQAKRGNLAGFSLEGFALR